MFPSGKFPMEEMMKPGRQAFEFWISFFPTAPLFGVEWRFGEMMSKGPVMPWSVPGAPVGYPTRPQAKAAAPVAPVAATPASTPAAPAPAPAPVAEKVVPAPKQKAAPKPAAKKAPKAAAPKAANAAPKPETAPAQAAADGKPAGLLAEKPAEADDLKLIKGIGPGLEKELNGLGVYRFDQMAAFKKADLEWIDENLTAFKGRCFRDDWTGQAKALLG